MQARIAASMVSCTAKQQLTDQKTTRMLVKSNAGSWRLRGIDVTSPIENPLTSVQMDLGCRRNGTHLHISTVRELGGSIEETGRLNSSDCAVNLLPRLAACYSFCGRGHVVVVLRCSRSWQVHKVAAGG